MSDKDTIRSDRAALIEALKEAGGSKFSGNSCCCPFHKDSRPSAGIFQKDGVWRFRCLACDAAGDVFDVRARIEGTSLGKQLKKTSRPKKQKRSARIPKSTGRTFANMDGVRQYLTSKVGDIESEHVYNDAGGDFVQVVFRCRTANGKSFRPCHLTDAGYALKASPKRWPIYRRSDIAQAEHVVVCEGEKCADVLSRYGFAATTSSAGARNASSADWSPLAGKRVTIWPDADAEGRRYAADVEGILQGLHPAPRLSLVDPASLDLGEHEDSADFIEQLQTVSQSADEITKSLAEAIGTARTLSIAGEVRQRIADIAAGRYAAIPFPWSLLSSVTKALLPGTVTLLAGSGGATKSFWTLQAFSYWLSLGLRVALFEVEEDRTFHLTRALAQESGYSSLTDPDWVKDNADLADEPAEQHGPYLDSIGRILHARADNEVTLDELATWVEDQACKGCRVIGCDPLTAAARSGDPWTADAKFLQRIKRTATNHGASIFLVTHPVKQVTFPDLTQLAGSACYQRFAQSIFWLELHEPKTSRLRTACGTCEAEHNRTLYILKARNGKGGGFKLAFDFDPESLKSRELGVILPKRKGNKND